MSGGALAGFDRGSPAAPSFLPLAVGRETLIVALGLWQAPLEMAMLMIGVVILTVVGWTTNRVLGVPMPLGLAKE